MAHCHYIRVEDAFGGEPLIGRIRLSKKLNAREAAALHEDLSMMAFRFAQSDQRADLHPAFRAWLDLGGEG